MQVFAVGKWLTFSSLDMQILGFIELKPNVGGREHEVVNNKNCLFCYAVNSVNISQKYTTDRLFSLKSVYTQLFFN